MTMGWNHIILEGFCGKNWEYGSKQGKWIYEFNADKEPREWKKSPNPNYDPEVEKPEWPDYCKKHICYICYEKDCPHLATAKGRTKDVIKYAKMQKKKRKNKHE